MMIDFRSDTVTRPTKQMLQAMMQAKVGDDVLGEDETINELEQKAAAMFNMEAAIFCPSGTMTNQIAIKCHTQPGDEVICEETSHVYYYEGGGIAFNSGCSTKLLKSHYGKINAQQVLASIHNPADVHKPLSKLVSIENTANRGGGSCYKIAEIEQIKKVCVENNLRLHLDGARLFNALVAANQNPVDYGNIFDSISICLSKGLGAPVGSLLLGTKELVTKARRIRKVLGGGMRQAGFLAAAGIFALDNHVERLKDDHTNAKHIAEALATKNFVGEILPVETNIIIFEIKPPLTAQQFTEKMKQNDMLMFAISDTYVRMVTHLDITESMTEKTAKIIRQM